MSTTNKNVFINCPFDKEYSQLLRCLIFTVVSLGYIPRIAIETSDAGTIRLNKIIEMINDSRISIHDLSRIKSSKESEYFRLNMPFELGLDFGYKHYSRHDNQFDKKYLILGKDKYEYMKALSDISGIDIKYHDDSIEKLIKTVRSWFVENEDLTRSLSPKEITNHFMDYNAEYYDYAKEQGYSEDEIPIKQQINFIQDFYSRRLNIPAVS